MMKMPARVMEREDMEIRQVLKVSRIIQEKNRSQ